MDYKILSFVSSIGSIAVSFYDLELDQEFGFNIDIPIENGEYISGEELDSYIKSFSPVFQINRLKEIKNKDLKKPSSITITEYIEPDLLLDGSLEQAKQFADDKVEAAVTEIRRKYISTLPGQENVYILKKEQALKFIENPDNLPSLHYIKEEAEIFNVAPLEIANKILEKFQYWNTEISPKLESLRVFAKHSINVSETNLEVENSLKQFNLATINY